MTTGAGPDYHPSEQSYRSPRRQLDRAGFRENEVWLEGSNDWIYPHLHIMADRMVELAGLFPEADGITRRALNQAVRELLLAQSSDWAFIMKTGTMVEYANKRTKDHIARFDRLYHDILSSHVNEQWLKEVESRDNIFPDIDYRVYRESR